MQAIDRSRAILTGMIFAADTLHIVAAKLVFSVSESNGRIGVIAGRTAFALAAPIEDHSVIVFGLKR